MSDITAIRSGIYWLGARHFDLKIFDELFPTRNGTTYNAYMVMGEEKIALIDTVKAPFAKEYLKNVEALAGGREIDYVVINHTEPDHSGALEKVLERYPQATVVCTRPAENFLRQLFNHPMKTHIVSDGEEIDLGGRTLTFLLAPYLHWPDTMFTWLPQDKLLFSCDAFGAHFCSEALFDDEAPDFSGEFDFYFDSIMRPFKEKVREAVTKVENLSIDMILPSHGPLIRRDVQAKIEAYRRLSAPAAQTGRKRALLLTLSPHGNTRDMAAFVREGLESRNVEVEERAIITVENQELRDLLESTDALVVATPTINRDAPPPVWQALSLLTTVAPRGKLGAVFGSFGWSGEAVKMVEERLLGLKYQLPVPGIHFRFKPTEEDQSACREFGQKVGDALRG
jgi:NADH oxidase (H2O-forming)